MPEFIWCCLLMLGVGPQVEVVTLDGHQYLGRLEQLAAAGLQIQQDGGPMTIGIAELMEVRFPNSSSTAKSNGVGTVTLVDGTTFGCTKVSAGIHKATLESRQFGKVEVEMPEVASVSFAAVEGPVGDAWAALCSRDLKKDLLVIRKGDVLDHLDGTVGEIDDAVVNFSADGENVAIKREKVFGVIYARQRRASGRDSANGSHPLACRVLLQGTDIVNARGITWNGSSITAELAAGARVTLPPESVRTLDFSLGKVRYLSQMQPREVKYTPFFDITHEYRRDRNLDGGPLRLGGRTYSRGLAIHSRTLLRYRLDGEYRRFRAVMGIDQTVGRNGDVHVVITGDSKALLEADVRGTDAPRSIDLDVSGVSELAILVDFGAGLDIADHLDLADAQIIK